MRVSGDLSQRPQRRERLLRPWHIGMLGLLLLSALVMLVPTPDKLEQSLTRPDGLSVQYLRLLLKVQPNSSSLKLRLAQELLAIGQLDEARRLLADLPRAQDSQPVQQKAAQLSLALDVAQYVQDPRHGAADPELRSRLMQRIEAMLGQQLSVEELLRLAASSLSIGRPDLAARAYLRLAEVDVKQRSKWLAKAAQQFNASGQPAAAGRLYDRLAQEETDLAISRAHALRALTALVAAGLGEEAALLARQYVARFRGDREILETAAKLALAGGHPEAAADFYDELARTVQDPAEQRRFARLALTAYTAANRIEDALHAAGRYLARFPGDLELSRLAIKLALGNHQPRRAQAWGRALLRQNPKDPALLAEQIGIELAVGDAAEALELSRRLVALQPGSRKQRERLAQIAQWTGNPRLALEQLLHLARHIHGAAAMQQALKLAPQLYELEALAELLALKARRGRLSNGELASLVQALEGIAEPERLVQILGRYLERYPDHYEAWEALAEVQERRGDPEGALQAYEHISRVFGSSVKEITHRAQLLWQLHRPTEAYALLRDALDRAGVADTHDLLTRSELAADREPAPAALSSQRATPEPTVTIRPHEPERQAFLHLLGLLFWHSEPRPESLEDYRRLWQAGALIPESAWRYCKQAKEQGRIDEALAIAESAFVRFHDPEFLLWAMDTSFAGERWKDVEREIQIAQRHEEQFASDKRYALLLAEYYTRIGDYDRAQRAYLKVVSLDPDSVAARAGVLWLLMDHADDRQKQRGRRNRWELRRLLTAWRGMAQEEPSLWLPFATGWAMLGRSRDAVDYYQREWIRRPNDHLWLLGYISTLDAVSRSSDARRLRRFALDQLHEEAKRAAHAGTTKAERESLLAYTVLVRDTYGAGKGSRWMTPIVRGPLDPEVRRGLLSVWRDDGSGVETSYFVTDSRRITRHNPWGRYEKAPRPGQQQLASTIGDGGTDNDTGPSDEPEPPPAPLRVMEPDAAPGETEVPARAQLVAIETGLQSISDLVIYSAVVSGWLARGSKAAGGHVRVNQLSTNTTDDPAAAATEVDLQAYGMWRHRLGRITFGLGANLRSDAHLFSGFLVHLFELGRGGTLQLDAHINELTQDTRWLRTYGARHRVTASWNTSVLTDGFVAAQASFYHYHTRTNEDIGAGVNAEMELGYRIRRVRPRWTVRVSGSYTRMFHLTNELPSFGDTSSYARTLLDALPPEFAAVGFGTRVEHRFPGVAPIGAGRWRYFGDLWLGWMWPLNIPAFEAHAGVGLALPRRQEISLSGFVANNRWLGPGVVNAGLQLRFSFR